MRSLGRWPLVWAAAWAGFYLAGLGGRTLVWDEAFYYPDVQRYRHGVFQAQGHPPLGKFFLLALESFRPLGAGDAPFLGKMFEGRIEAPASLLGFRLPGAIAALGCAAICGLLALRATGSRLCAGMAGLLVLLDGFTLVLFRCGMLDPFLCLYLLGCAHLALCVPRRRMGPWAFVILGALAGAAAAIKATGAIAALAAIPLAARHRRRRPLAWATQMAGGWLLVWAAAWYLHCGMGRVALPGTSGMLGPWYASVLDRGATWDPRNLPRMALEQARFGAAEHASVSSAHPLAPAVRFASRPWEWPLGGRPVYFADSPDMRCAVVLWANRPGWLFSLAGVAAAACLCGTLWLSGGPPARLSWARWSGVVPWLVAAWASYMASISAIPRILYLYHYAPALHWTIAAGVSTFWVLCRPSPKMRAAAAWAAMAAAGLGFFALLGPCYGTDGPPERLARMMWFDDDAVVLP